MGTGRSRRVDPTFTGRDVPRTPIEMQFSSPPAGNLTMNLEPAFSSESLSGRNLQTTLILSSAAISRSLGVSIAIATRASDDDNGDDDDCAARARAPSCLRMCLGGPMLRLLFLRLLCAALDHVQARAFVQRRIGEPNAYRMKEYRRTSSSLPRVSLAPRTNAHTHSHTHTRCDPSVSSVLASKMAADKSGCLAVSISGPRSSDTERALLLGGRRPESRRHGRTSPARFTPPPRCFYR